LQEYDGLSNQVEIGNKRQSDVEVYNEVESRSSMRESDFTKKKSIDNFVKTINGYKNRDGQSEENLFWDAFAYLICFIVVLAVT